MAGAEACSAVRGLPNENAEADIETRSRAEACTTRQVCERPLSLNQPQLPGQRPWRVRLALHRHLFDRFAVEGVQIRIDGSRTQHFDVTGHWQEGSTKTRRMLLWMLLIVSLVLASIQVASAADNPLPSWNDGAAKHVIVEFVRRVTTPGGPDFVPVAERIATFDNDSTLWAEQPIYFQVAFALDRVKALAPQHPEWKEMQPFKAVLEGDLNALAAAWSSCARLPSKSMAFLPSRSLVARANKNSSCATAHPCS
jgi:hypothetical protein